MITAQQAQDLKTGFENLAQYMELALSIDSEEDVEKDLKDARAYVKALEDALRNTATSFHMLNHNGKTDKAWTRCEQPICQTARALLGE